MNVDESSLTSKAGKEISALIRTLFETEQRLHELTEGAKSVTDRDGRVFLLRRGQEQLRERETARRTSEEKFTQLAATVSDVFWVYSPDARQIVYANPAYERVWGRTVESLYAHPEQWSEAILPGDRARVIAEFYRLLNADSSVSSEFRIERPDGTVRWIWNRGFPVLDEAGKVIRINGIATDITERKLMENALRESNDNFQLLANNITDVFWIRSSDMRTVHYVSPAFEKIWGRPMEFLYANPHQWVDFIFPEDRDRVTAAFAELTGNTRSLDIEYRIMRPSGEIRWIRARGFQVRDANDKLFRHLGIVTDITERKQVEVQLFQSQKMETVGKLAGGVAHEFNSLLTVIMGRTDLLLADLPKGSDEANNVTEISKAADRASALTRQLLAYGRKQFFRRETLNLNAVLGNMAGMLRHLMGISVATEMALDPELHAAKADAGQLEQVIVNMAMNARDAMPGGGKLTLATANVRLDEESGGRDPELKPGHYVMLTISDTGTGMSEEVKRHVFEPFFTTKDTGQGTGLGLSTCYGIIKQSGGHIHIESEIGKGTTFQIYLPDAGQTP